MLEWWERLGFLAMGLGFVGWLGYLWWRLPAVLRGADPPDAGHMIPVYRRSYLSFLGLATAVCGSFAVLLTSGSLGWLPGVMVGLATLPLGLPFGLLHLSVNLTNRPRFLVPPALRDQPGSLARGRQRRARRRAGRPSTEHLVKLYELPRDLKDQRAQLCAICDDEECEWTEFADDGARDQEADLRRKAARHTNQAVPPVVPAPTD